MSYRPLAFFGVFPALPVLLSAQRPAGVDRQLVAARLWVEARYNYAYWDGVRANWDSAFAATVTFAGERPPRPPRPPPVPLAPPLLHPRRRRGALLHDGQFDVLAPPRVATPPPPPPPGPPRVGRRPLHL